MQSLLPLPKGGEEAPLLKLVYRSTVAVGPVAYPCLTLFPHSRTRPYSKAIYEGPGDSLSNKIRESQHRAVPAHALCLSRPPAHPLHVPQLLITCIPAHGISILFQQTLPHASLTPFATLLRPGEPRPPHFSARRKNGLMLSGLPSCRSPAAPRAGDVPGGCVGGDARTVSARPSRRGVFP